MSKQNSPSVATRNAISGLIINSLADAEIETRLFDQARRDASLCGFDLEVLARIYTRRPYHEDLNRPLADLSLRQLTERGYVFEYQLQGCPQ